MGASRSIINAIALIVFTTVSCSKGKATVDKSRESSNYSAKAAKNYENIPARYTFTDNIEFFVTTSSGAPLPSIGSEFRAFDITALYEGGETIKAEKIPVMLKTFQDNWNTNFFTLDVDGAITTKVTCENGTTREACVGDLTGSSTKTDREGRAFTGYKTPDGPGSMVAVVLKVPEGSSASNLMQYSTIEIQSWSDFGKNGESPLEAALLIVPQLENDEGEPVIKAGVGFSVNLIIPGIPSTPKGEGYLFDFETTGVEGVDNDRIVVPSGKNVKCSFRGGLCALPGGPFKVLSPTTMTITVKPSASNFPVKTAKLEIPVITGSARTIMLSTTYPAKTITNLCTSGNDFSKPCIELSADIDEIEVYPFLADEGGNFVGLVPTEWSASGPLATRLDSDKVSLTQIIRPQLTGSGIINVSTAKGFSSQFTYMVRSGTPAKVEFKTEHFLGSSSTERVGIPFKVISTLYDRKDNLCVDYNTTFGVKLKLNPVYPATPPPGISATVTLADEIDQTSTKILVTRGVGVSTESFTVAKVPNLSSGQSFPTIEIVTSSLNLAVINPLPITILPGVVNQSILRNYAGGLGTSWDEITTSATGTSFTADRNLPIRSDQQYFFNNAGYDAGGNYVIDVPSKFWGVSYIYHPTTPAPFDNLVATLKTLDPSSFSTDVACPNPVPDSVPPSQVPTNQPSGNMIYCGVHRGLLTKQGVNTPFASSGIPGTGRVLAIPLDVTIRPAISPMLNVTSGLASKIRIELVDTNPAAVPQVLANPISAGKPFKVMLTATDDDDVVATDFAGSKTFDFSSSAFPSWGGLQPVLPDGNITCTFVSGTCTLDGPYSIARGTGTAGLVSSQSITSIALEQLVPNGEVGIPGIHTQFVRSIPGAEKSIFFTDKKGGLATGAVALHPISYPGGITVKASQEFGFGLAIADASGNFVRDVSPADDIQVRGFEGTFTDLTGAPNNYFNFSTGTWSTTTWPTINTEKDLFVANPTPPAGIAPTIKKFFDPSVPADASLISTIDFKNASTYSLVLVPQNRLGKGFAVPFSANNPSLIAWPSPLIEITPGLLDHASVSVVNSTDNTVKNDNITAGQCNELKVVLSDAKGNQLTNYTTVTNMKLKIFNVNASNPNGVDDPKVGAAVLTTDEYNVLNKSEIPGPVNSGFSATAGSGGRDNSLEAKAKSLGGISSIDPVTGQTIYGSFFADWWSGPVSVNSGTITMPGYVCFQDAQTIANRLTTPVTQKIIQVELAPSTYANNSFEGIVSRGANRVFNTTYGSTAPGSGHNDILTIKRGAAHHLHGTYVDSFQNPLFAWLGPTRVINSNFGGNSDNGDQLGVESPCPFPQSGYRGGCVSKTIYWHIHDKACNYIGPATNAYDDPVGSPAPGSFYNITPVASGPEGSAGTFINKSDNSVVPYLGDPAPAFVTNGTLVGSWWAAYKPGRPVAVSTKLYTEKGSLNVDDYFGIDFATVDQYGNAVSKPDLEPLTLIDRNPYSASKEVKLWSDIQPSNAPTGEAPERAKFISGTWNIGTWTASSYATAYTETPPLDLSNSFDSGNLTFRRANQPITIFAEFKELAPSVWCTTPGNCPSTGVQTFTGSRSISLTPGAAQGVEILDDPLQSGLPFNTASFSAIFTKNSGVYPLLPSLKKSFVAYACLHDSYRNMFNCQEPSSWAVVDKRDKLNNPTTEPVLEFDSNSSGNPLSTIRFDYMALREGTAKLEVTHSGFVKTSDPINVWPGPLDHLSLTSGIADDPLAPVAIAAGQEIPVQICLQDEANRTIDGQVIHASVLKTDPTLTYNVNFVSNVVANAEGKGIVLSTASGASFDSNTFTLGSKALQFTNGCKTIYIKNFAAGVVNGGSLLSVTTTDPLRPGSPIDSTDGLFVSSTTPGALDHFATNARNTSNTPIIGTVPAWSNVLPNAGYANAGGNRFDLRIVARDAFGNDVPSTTSVTLSRLKSDGVTQVARPFVCQGETTLTVSTCMTANFSNASEVIVSGLASDIAGTMYVMATNGSITTTSAVSQVVNFQASIKTVKDYTILNLQSTVPAGEQFLVQIAATDNSGAAVSGADDVLSAEVFSAVDNLNANLNTHLSPNSTAPTIPTTYAFNAGTAYAPFILTKKESLSFRVKDSTGLQSNLGTINVLSSSGLAYQISCKLASDNSDCSGTSGTPYQMAASRANLFNLVIENNDIFGNKKPGDTSLYISPVRISGVASIATLISSTPKSYIGIGLENFINFSTADENGFTLDNLFYGVGGQTITFNLPNMSTTSSITKNVYINFLPHIDTVRSYPVSGFGSNTFSAGTVKNFQLRAVDFAGNTLVGIDAALNAQTYTWTGAGTSPFGNTNIIPTTALTFTNGVTQSLTATFFDAKNYVFEAVDNYTHSVTLGGESAVLPRESDLGDLNSISVNPRPPTSYILSGITSTAEAGTPFTLTLSTKDIYGNPNSGWTDSLTFSYLSGASPSIVNPANGSVFTATKAANITNQVFANGSYSVPGNPFTLYRSNLLNNDTYEVTQLKIQGTNTNTESGTALSASIDITTTPKAATAYSKITTAATYSAGTELSGQALSYSADNTFNYYHYLFDEYGNFKSPSNSVNWVGTGALANKMTPSSGAQTLVAPITRGTGVITANCSALSGCLSDSTGTITVSTGPLQTFAITDPITGSNVNLGQEVPLQVCLKDAVGNTIDTSVYIGGVLITDPNATLSLEVRQRNISDNPERQAIAVSKASGAGFDGARINITTGTTNLTFVNGCTSLYTKIFSRSSGFGGNSLLQIRFDDINQPAKGTLSGSGFDVPGVNVMPLHHYATIALNTSGGTVEALSDLGTTNVLGQNGGNRFSIRVEARDLYGNAVTTSNTVALSMVRNDGVTPVSRSLVCSAPANDTSCLNPTFSASSSVVVDNLALDVAGSFFVKALDSGSIGTDTQFSSIIDFKASPKTINKYVITHPVQITAGQSTFIQIRAEDNSGNPVSGADAALEALTYTFFNSVDSTLMSTHIAPDLTDPIVPSILDFNGGVATPTLTFVKSENGLKLNIRDNFTVQKLSNNLADLEISPGFALYYEIICKRASDSSDCTGTAGSPTAMNASAADKFNLEFNSFDQYRNPKLGEGSARAFVNRLSGTAANTGQLETITGGYSYSLGDLDVNMATLGMVPKSGMYYRVGNQSIRIVMSNTMAFGYYKTPYINFTPTIDTVTNFSVNTALTGIAGVPQVVSVNARDSGSNVITGIDAALSAQSYTWSGPLSSPNASTPSLPSSSLTFTSGSVTGLSATFKKSESASLSIIDDYVPCGSCSNVGGSGPLKERRGTGYSTIGHAPSARYEITGGGASTKAGVPFDLVITALDEFDNPATTWSSDSLSFAWTGANSSVSNPKNASTFSPTLATNGVKTFSTGSFSTVGSVFSLFKAENPTLTVTGTTTAGTKDGSALIGTRVFSVLPNDTAGYVTLSSSSNPLNPTLTGSVFSLQTDQSMNLFAHLYDGYGNIKSDASQVGWTGSGALAGKLTPALGYNTLFAPTTVGTGAITASCTGVSAGCLPDSTGTLDIQPSNVAKIVFISPSPSNNFSQLTTACQQLQIQTQDLVNNPANVISNTVFTFASTGGNGDFYSSSAECTAAQVGRNTLNTGTFHTSTLGGSAGARTLTMSSGANVLSVWFANRTAVPSNGAQIVVTALSRTATLNATITPDVARRVSFITTTPTVNAVGSPSSTCLTLNYRIDDIWGNQQTLTSSSTIDMSVTGTEANTAVIYANSNCTSSITSRTLNGVNQDTVYYNDTKANRSTFNILSSSTLNGSAIQAANSIAIDVLPGSFTITGTPASGAYTKDTVTLTWGSSSGAKNYRVHYGTTSTCGINISTTATGNSISFATGLNGVYYICIVGNSYTSGGVNLNATNHGSYNFVIDNLAPTGTITAPTLASIGPVSPSVGSGATTTFTGTASDTGGSGLSKVELEVRNGSNYWNGTAWTTTPSVVLATGTSSWSYVMNDSDFIDGTSYNLRAQVTDNSNNVTASAATRAFVWDTVSPTVSITAFGNLLSSNYYSNATSLNTALTTSTGAITYRFYIVSGSSCSGGTYSGDVNLATNITSSPGADGQYTLCVIGKDQAGNEQASPTAFPWFKDTLAPTIAGGVANIGPVNAAHTPSLTAAVDSGAPAGSVVSYLWSVTTNASTCTTAFGNTAVQNTSITSTCGNSYGTSTLRLRVSDTAGNLTDYSPTFNWDQELRFISSISSSLSSVSRKAGDTIDISVTFAKSGGNSNSASITVDTGGGTPTLALNTTPARSANYVSTSGNVLTFSYVIQAGDNQATLNVSGTSAFSLNGATIKDTYNNNTNNTAPTNTLNTRAIKIDTVAPSLTATGIPSNPSMSTTLNVAIGATDTSTYTYSLVSGTSAACPGTQSGSRARTVNITDSISAMPDGDITICAAATDAAGNVQSGFTSYTWTKDTTPPAVLTGIAPATEINTLTPTVTWNAAAGDVTGIWMRIYSNAALSTIAYEVSGYIAAGATSHAVSVPQDGKYYICLYTQDLAGNWSNLSCPSPSVFTVETDILHTSWYDSGVVKYASKDKTSAWSVSTAASGLTYQGRTSLAVDPSGNPIIGYSTVSGSDSFFRYSKWNGSAWSASLAHTTSGYTTGGTLGELVVSSANPNLHLGFLAYDAGTSSLGAEIVAMASSNVATSTFQALADPGFSFNDLSVFVDASSFRYLVATPKISGIFRPQITETSSLTPFLPALPTNCTEMPFISGVSTKTGTSFVLAGLCVMTDTSCQVWSSPFTFTSGTGSYSAASWTNRGTAKTSACTLGGLTMAHRPIIMQDKQSDKTTIVFVDQTNNKIVRSSNEGSGWASEDVVTGLTGTYGSPFIALDQYGKTYVTYVNNGILYMINNNGRENSLFTGGWNTPSQISNTGGMSGFGGIGLTGMRGRGYYPAGK